MEQEIQKQFVFERFSDDAARMMNQTTVRSRMAPMADGPITNACFDGIMAPDGRFYFPLSSESGECGNTKLAYFDYDKDGFSLSFSSIPQDANILKIICSEDISKLKNATGFFSILAV